MRPTRSARAAGAARRSRSWALRTGVLFALLGAALLGLALPAPGAAAGAPGAAQPPPGAGRDPALGRVDLKGWAAAQRKADGRRDTRSVPRVRTVRPLPALRAAAPKNPKTLVLYDTTGPYGHLGELYAMAAANLAGHFGDVDTRPVSRYEPGLLGRYTAAVYLGSTYYGGSVPDAVPAAFYRDVAAGTRPVTWLGANIWNMARAVGTGEFAAKYGWDPANSHYEEDGSVGEVTSVSYRNQTLTRTVPPGQDGGVLRPALLTGPGYPQVTELAEAHDTASGTSFPWAIRSANLTYLGEIPFTYVSESDRVLALADLLFDALAPDTAERHRAIVRLEDISPQSDPDKLRALADYLYEQKIPYGINVVPVYKDPRGVLNNGQPLTVTLAQRPRLVGTLKYMLARGAVLMNHGYTHQYSDLNNPYNGVTGDDFEFYRAHVDPNDYVVYDGPVAEDSAAWAQGRVSAALAEFTRAGLPRPRLWTTPHYAASAVDYGVFARNFPARLERSLYFSGTLPGGTAAPNRFIGQFFPYVVKDVYGTKVIPENLGNYEPTEANHHPPRLPADLVKSARANLAVRDGFASFFYHPYFPVEPLKETVEGIKALGYTFVNPASL